MADSESCRNTSPGKPKDGRCARDWKTWTDAGTELDENLLELDWTWLSDGTLSTAGYPSPELKQT